jgi:long-chain fatty acid transport protein
MSAFFQSGNYAEAGFTVIDPTVEGTSTVVKDEKISDMGGDYYFPSAAIKIQPTDNISLGLLYDQPFGADATYSSTAGTFGNGTEGTSVEVDTHNLTALIGYQPNQNWNFYAGPVYQTVEGKVSLRGAAYGGTRLLGGYDIDLKEDDAFGWIAGAAYSIPEIALRAAITYRSEIKHELDTSETFALGAVVRPNSNTEVVTPQSVNIDLQSGVAKDTLAFANIRWVHWDQFAVKPTYLAAATQAARGKAQNLIDYSDDQWSITTGLSHKFNDKWAGSASVGYDSGAGNPVTTLGPVEGNWSIGLGAQYSPAQSYFIAAGVRYLWLGDANAQTGGNVVGSFEDNSALAYGMKIGYRF